MSAEFTCAGCGAWVFSAAQSTPPEDGLCFKCAFLAATFPDPEERAAVRALVDRESRED